MEIISRKQAILEESKYYYTGCPCKNGHLSKRFTSNGTCYQCVLDRNAIYQENNPEKVKASKSKWYRKVKSEEYEKEDRSFISVTAYISRTKLRLLKHRYNISEDEVKSLLKSNNYLCHICNEPETSKTKDGRTIQLSVDHCHETGKVRGMLCYKCNTALGLLKDSKELFLSAIQYLERCSLADAQ